MKKTYSLLKGRVSNSVLYPAAQFYQKRTILTKFNELTKIYNDDFAKRKRNNLESLISILEYSKNHVPYYRDLFDSIGFNPQKLRNDFSHFESIPFLTKDILLEQGSRMLSDEANSKRVHSFKTGGSTGDSVFIYYDQEALDWSSAITLYARDRIGHKNWQSEIHFASRYPEAFCIKDRLKEFSKCFVMNRENIFFDSLDDQSLKKIWKKLNFKSPNLVHAHPSTMYAIAQWAMRARENKQVFDVFESSGELLDQKKRDVIAEVLKCKVVDRYGLAEFGVVAYELNGNELQIFDSFVYPESNFFEESMDVSELVFTGLTNYLMPLIRYRTGDGGLIKENESGYVIENILGRVHDTVIIKGVEYQTHYIQDVLDRIGGIKEFQIKRSAYTMTLSLVPEENASVIYIKDKIEMFFGKEFLVEFVSMQELIKVGWRDKFRYVVDV